MINWRKPFLKIIFGVLGASTQQFHRLDKKSLEDLELLKKQKLQNLLDDAFENVPYYRELFTKENLLGDDGKFDLKNFEKIPYLTKDIISENLHDLESKSYSFGRKYNTSGGSTGEPVRFLQDYRYRMINVFANKIYFNEILGKKLGEPEINLWGSERDINSNSESKAKDLLNWLYNRTFLNAFSVDDDKLASFVKIINRKKPVSMWVYVESIDVLARYIEENNLEIYSPKFIISTAGTLYPEIRDRVERVFKCPVYNQYGSREVGPMAIECFEKKGLHMFPWSHHIEVINGDIIVTVLTNRAMPIVRFKIGDTAESVANSVCPCGRNTLIFESVKGRTINHIKRPNGRLIHGQLLIHMFYYQEWIKKFQFIQTSLNEFTIRYISNRKNLDMEKAYLENRLRKLLGKGIIITWKEENKIEPSKSGKYLYVISKV
jgi:phenylacetate-CoA ligase